MDLDFSEEQEMLRETVRGLCERYVPMETVRALEDDPTGYSPEFWKQVGELGILGLTLPEAYGGSGLGTLEAAVVYEELGRALAPSPHFVSSVVSAGAIQQGAGEADKKKWLPKIASGDVIVTPAWLEPDGSCGPTGVRATATVDGNEIVLAGTKRHVYFASSAAALLVLARSGAGGTDLDLLLVDPATPGITMTIQPSLAGDSQSKVVLDGARVPASARIGRPGEGWKIFNRVMHEGVILLAAEAVGGTERALEITVQYSLEREQFGKPLGAFQAISHYLADGTTLANGAKTLMYEAAWAASAGKPIDRLGPMAKLFACHTYRDVTAMCEQVYGGYGFTVDFDIQLFFRRAKQLQLSWWDTRYLEQLVAAAVLDHEAA